MSTALILLVAFAVGLAVGESDWWRRLEKRIDRYLDKLDEERYQ